VTGREARRDMSFGCSSPAPGAPRFVVGHRVGTRRPQVDIEDGALPAGSAVAGQDQGTPVGLPGFRVLAVA